jgi:DNA-binding Xre family transcriptional regulator
VIEEGENKMAKTISYDKLWKLLIDKKMNRTDLKEKSGISTASLAKLGKGENLTTGVLLKICDALDCDVSDIMEVVQEDASESAD